MPYELDRRSPTHNSYLPLVAMMPAVPVLSTCTPAVNGGIPSCGPWTAAYRLAYEQARAALRAVAVPRIDRAHLELTALV